MAAGALIDRAGLKGRRVGGAYVSEKHANFILADPGATASDVLKLINIIRDTVHQGTGVYLELEIEVW
jgi:UDP-N-acetylmuramate dehydrogenase